MEDREKKKTPQLTFVIGVNATGKSYFINRHYGDKDAERLDIWDYQDRAYKEEGVEKFAAHAQHIKCLTQANENLLQDAISLLSAGRDVVAEHTLFRAKRRIAYIDAVRRQLPEVKIVFYVMQPDDALWESNIQSRKHERSLQSLKEEAGMLEFPNPAEGIDEIYTVTGDQIRLRMDPPRQEILEPARAEVATELAETARREQAKKAREELVESMKERCFWHYCEVCGKKEFLTAQDAFDSGWDYPPNIGFFGLLGPRTCGSCGITGTLYWKVTTGGGLPIVIEKALSPEELITWRRIKGEPESLLREETAP